MSDSFLPTGYDVPASSGNFTRIEAGDTQLRILSKPELGWVAWEGGQVLRVPYSAPKPEIISQSEKDSVKHFWGVVVWNYKTSQIEFWEISQRSIQNALANLFAKTGWENPFTYDITVTKKGSALSTEYAITPSPHTAVSPVIQEAYNMLTIVPGNVFTDRNIFETKTVSAPAPAATPVSSTLPLAQEAPTPTPTPTATQEREIDPVVSAWQPGQPAPSGYRIVDNGNGGEILKKSSVPF